MSLKSKSLIIFIRLITSEAHFAAIFPYAKTLYYELLWPTPISKFNATSLIGRPRTALSFDTPLGIYLPRCCGHFSTFQHICSFYHIIPFRCEILLNHTKIYITLLLHFYHNECCKPSDIRYFINQNFNVLTSQILLEKTNDITNCH